VFRSPVAIGFLAFGNHGFNHLNPIPESGSNDSNTQRYKVCFHRFGCKFFLRGLQCRKSCHRHFIEISKVTVYHSSRLIEHLYSILSLGHQPASPEKPPRNNSCSGFNSAIIQTSSRKLNLQQDAPSSATRRHSLSQAYPSFCNKVPPFPKLHYQRGSLPFNKAFLP